MGTKVICYHLKEGAISTRIRENLVRQILAKLDTEAPQLTESGRQKIREYAERMGSVEPELSKRLLLLTDLK